MPRSALKKVTIDLFLLWVYQAQKADIVIDHGVGLHSLERMADGHEVASISGDGCYQIMMEAEIGARVDYSGRGGARLHTDADLAHDIVKSGQVSHYHRGVILDYGRSGRIPDWMPDAAPRMVPLLNKRGRLKMLRVGADGKGRAAACLVKPEIVAGYIDAKRKMYKDWHDALNSLALLLAAHRDMMTGYDVQPLTCSREPWIKSA